MTSPVPFLGWRPAGLLLLLGVFTLGCGTGRVETATPGGQPGLDVLPRLASLPPGGAELFVAQTPSASSIAVDWSASAGTITTAGLYTAPTETGSYQIQARYAGLTGSALAVVSPAGTPAAFYASASSSCASMPLRTTGITYYFCDCQALAQAGCVAGNDANAGTSPSAPKQTWGAVIAAFNRMAGGDTIALCRGGAWAVAAPASAADCSNQLTNPRCAAGASLTDPTNTSTCDIRDFSPTTFTGSAKPIVRASTASSTRLLNRYTGSTNGVRIMNLDFRGGNAGPRGGTYYDHRAIASGLCNTQADSHWLICNNNFDRLRLALNLSNTGTSSNFLVWGNSFTMNDLDAILGFAGDNNQIDANFFDNNGGFIHPVTGNRGHTIYITRNSNPASIVSTNISITNNQFLRSGAGSTPGTCAAGTVVGHAQWNGVNVENNLFDGGAGVTANCWAIDLRAAASDPTYFRNLTVRRNWVDSGVGIVVGQSPGVVIENNVVVLPGNHTWKHGIMSPMDAARVGLDDVQNNTIIRNNTIYMTGGAVDHEGILVGAEGTGHVISNNTVHAGGGTCFSTPLAAGAYAFVGNNACYGAAWGTTYDATTHVTADPRFVSPPTDFRPAAGSPLIGAGNAAQAPRVDFTLVKTRPSPPSIGAYEP